MKAELINHFKAAVVRSGVKLDFHDDDDFGEAGFVGKPKFIVVPGDVNTTQESTHFQDSLDVELQFFTKKGKLTGIEDAQAIRREAIKEISPLSSVEALGISGSEIHDKKNLITVRFNVTVNLTR